MDLTILMSSYYLFSLEALLTYRYARIAKCTIVLRTHYPSSDTYFFRILAAENSQSWNPICFMFTLGKICTIDAMLHAYFISFWSLFDATWVHYGKKAYELRKNILKISYLFEYSSIWFDYKSFWNFRTIKLVRYILNHSSTPTIVICVQKRWMILDSNYPLDIFNGS